MKPRAELVGPKKESGMDQTDSSTPRHGADGKGMAINVSAQVDALQAFLVGLEADLAAASQEVRQLALDLLDLAPKLADVQAGPAAGADVTILLEPSRSEERRVGKE